MCSSDLQVDGDGVVLRKTQGGGHGGGGFQFAAVALAVVERQPDHPLAGLLGQGGGGGGIEPSGEQGDGGGHSGWGAP